MSEPEIIRTTSIQPSMIQSQSQSNPGPSTAALTAASYRSNPDAYNELFADSKSLRPHYAKLFGGFEEFNPAELRHRHETCSRFIQEQGITYHVYGDPRGMERPWQLDPVPFVLAPDEWRTLEAGLIQRAVLLNKILADCYGNQELIRSRWLSPALVFAQPDFLRPCHGIRLPRNLFLHFYAADLARSPDGRWWVVSDRTQIPTGAGYALANRLVTSRIFPESFRENNVHRLAGYFRKTQETLAQLSPRHSDRARVVMLTPGPHNETYFEQAYLARYLGYMLVEGQDLTVRDNCVFLKTLSGLERVDVIWRRVDDDFCDPLELRNDSILGVPGLAEAVRAGNVVIANALGTGLLQSPAFMSFLPGLCRQILGEELLLPSVATWWCGQKTAQQYVLKNLETLVVKPAFRNRLSVPDPDKKLTDAQRSELRRRIEFDPDLFVAQENVRLSSAPCWEDGRFVARPISLRTYLVASGDSYSVMPGGLARVAPAAGGQFVSMQQGSSSKDAWVISHTPVEEITLLQSTAQSVELRRTGNNLPSRLADNFFWLGRYSERADATSRLLRSAALRFNPERTGGALPVLAPLLQTLALQGQIQNLLDHPDWRKNAEVFEAEVLAAIFDPERPGSLHQIVDFLQRLAMLVRDRTSNDMWRVLNQLGDTLTLPSDKSVMLAGDAVSVLSQVLLGLAAFHGLARENMTRAQAWRFLDIGLRLERAIYLGTLLDATLRSPEAENPSVLEAVLEVADSSITYRSRYNLLPTLPAVFDLVLLDDKNPRSILFQVEQLAKHFERLPREREDAPGSGKAILQKSLSRLQNVDSRELASLKGEFTDSMTGQTIQETLRDLPKLSDTIAASYFAHSTISRTGRGAET